jgi:molybdopterin-containing oxidoreductase family iron-sulfur binding subunit
MTAGEKLWRNLEQAADDPAFLAHATQEFPGLAAALAEPLGRRQVLRLMAASIALGGLAGCDTKYGGNLIPAVTIPPNIIPAVPNFYATAHVLDGYASGVVVKHVMGRPVNVDGNPEHPASLGAIDVYGQAQLLDFYDPDRSAEIMQGNIPAARVNLDAALSDQRVHLAAGHGAGLRILTGSVTSPTLIAQIEAVQQQYPEAQWIQWDPISRDAARQASWIAYGRPLEMIAYLDKADVLLSIDGDLLSSAPGRLRYARDFASRRNPSRTASMSRVYAIEPTPTLIGSVADHRFIAGPTDLRRIVMAVAASVLHNAPTIPEPGWVDPLVTDLKAARGRVLMHVGAAQPPELHALALAINEALGARGVTFDLIEPAVPPAVLQADAMGALIADMHAGTVGHLLIIDSNPLYTSPRSWGFAEALRRVPFSVALARRCDETARSTSWFVPQSHDWEAWSDARAYDGTVTVLQPQALPLYGGLSAHQMLGMYLTRPPVSTEESVRNTWAARLAGHSTDGWSEALARGLLPGTASAASDVRLRTEPRTEAAVAASLTATATSTATATGNTLTTSPGDGLTLLLRVDPNLWDGRFANNPWLQELPRPLTKVVWDNPVLIAPALAARMQLTSGDCIRLTIDKTSVVAPVWIMPGQAPDCVTALLGSGRRAAGSVGDDVGVDFYPLTGLTGPVVLGKIEARVELASTVHHDVLMDTPSEILRHGTLAQFLADPRFAATARDEPHLYRTLPPGPAAWGMSIDLNACIGCNACIVACQAENNISVVGKAQVLREREMHWLRIDRYFEGSADAPESFFQPVLCMHCEEAPCENVCPVGATVHDAEGLNVMVYNRCVGTRFCSNNCPYKVRRFNFYGYAREQPRPAQSWNPDVTVRARGVMEKCTYCIQRVAEARIVADRDSRPVGEVRTACQNACPTQAFTFGNLADPTSAVAGRKRSSLNFAMLEGQGTRPRTTYEALVRNPNPAIRTTPT